MSQPVKLSDALVLDARLMSEATERSIAGQIEFWASLGKAAESILGLPALLQLRRVHGVRPLAELMAEVGTDEGGKRLEAHLASAPYPHFEPTPDGRALVKIEADGSRTTGRFVNRVFVASPLVDAAKPAAPVARRSKTASQPAPAGRKTGHVKAGA